MITAYWILYKIQVFSKWIPNMSKNLMMKIVEKWTKRHYQTRPNEKDPTTAILWGTGLLGEPVTLPWWVVVPASSVQQLRPKLLHLLDGNQASSHLEFVWSFPIGSHWSPLIQSVLPVLALRTAAEKLEDWTNNWISQVTGHLAGAVRVPLRAFFGG